MTKQEWIEWEIEQARLELVRAKDNFESDRYFRRELTSAVNHALWAWTRAHSARLISNNQSAYEAFSDDAPEELINLHTEAASALSRLDYGLVSSLAVLEVVNRMIEAITKAMAMKSFRVLR